MDAKDHSEQSSAKSSICSLEWIAWAIEAARRHKEDEQRETPTRPGRVATLSKLECARR